MPRRVSDEVFIPRLIYQSVGQAIAEFQRREFEIGDALRRLYIPVFSDYRSNIERFFLKHFYKNLNDAKEPVWDPIAARRFETYNNFKSNLDEMLEALEQEASTILDEDLVDGLWTGNNLENWIIFQSGVDMSEIGDLPDFDSSKALLLAAGIGGLGYLSRLNRWTTTYKQKFGRFLRSAINGGLTLDSTLIGIDSLRKGLVSSVVGLGQNELKNAFTRGAILARINFQEDIEGEVWLSRDDVLVCPLCAKLNLTITNLQPIIDSHPRCRCWKVPIALDFRAEPIDYVAFLQSIGRR